MVSGRLKNDSKSARRRRSACMSLSVRACSNRMVVLERRMLYTFQESSAMASRPIPPIMVEKTTNRRFFSSGELARLSRTFISTLPSHHQFRDQTPLRSHDRASNQPDHGDSFVPGILIISGERINFIEQGLRRDLSFLSGKINTTIGAKDPTANDRGRHGFARNAGQQRGLAIVE